MPRFIIALPFVVCLAEGKNYLPILCVLISSIFIYNYFCISSPCILGMVPIFQEGCTRMAPTVVLIFNALEIHFGIINGAQESLKF